MTVRPLSTVMGTLAVAVAKTESPAKPAVTAYEPAGSVVPAQDWVPGGA